MGKLTKEQRAFRDTTHTYHMDNHRNASIDVWTVYESGGTYGTRHPLKENCTEAEAEASVRTLRIIDPEAK